MMTVLELVCCWVLQMQTVMLGNRSHIRGRQFGDNESLPNCKLVMSKFGTSKFSHCDAISWLPTTSVNFANVIALASLVSNGLLGSTSFYVQRGVVNSKEGPMTVWETKYDTWERHWLCCLISCLGFRV